MSLQYAAKLPIDAGGNSMQEYPAAKVALARYGTTTGTVSSVITMTDSTTVLEIVAAGQAVALKWITAADTIGSVIATGATANFDHIIPTGETHRFVVPIATAGVQSIVGANKQNGLFNRYALIPTGGSASVFAGEF